MGVRFIEGEVTDVNVEDKRVNSVKVHKLVAMVATHPLVQLVWLRGNAIRYTISRSEVSLYAILIGRSMMNGVDVTLPLNSPNNCIPIPY